MRFEPATYWLQDKLLYNYCIGVLYAITDRDPSSLSRNHLSCSQHRQTNSFISAIKGRVWHLDLLCEVLWLNAEVLSMSKDLQGQSPNYVWKPFRWHMPNGPQHPNLLQISKQLEEKEKTRLSRPLNADFTTLSLWRRDRECKCGTNLRKCFKTIWLTKAGKENCRPTNECWTALFAFRHYSHAVSTSVDYSFNIVAMLVPFSNTLRIIKKSMQKIVTCWDAYSTKFSFLKIKKVPIKPSQTDGEAKGLLWKV